MTTRLGYDGSSGWYGWVASGINTNNMIAGVNNANNRYVMPESGYINDIGVFAAGSNGYTPAAEIYVIYNNTAVVYYDFTLSGGSQSIGGQHWTTASGFNYFIPSGGVVSIGIWTDPNSWRVWSYQNDSAYQWDDGYVASKPSAGGNFGSHSLNGGQKIGAYLDYTPAAPIINSLSAGSGAVNTQFTIQGYAFQAASQVTINGTTCAFTINSDQQLTVTVAAGATQGTVAVTNPYGTTSGPTFTPYAAPTISGMSPTSGAPGTVVTVTGHYFTTVNGVTLNGAAVSYTVQSDTQLTFNITSSASTGAVVVSNPYGSGNAGTFTYTGGPNVTSLSPTYGFPGTVISISGSLFTGVTSATIDGVSCSFNVASDTAMTVTIALGATTGPLALTNANGTTTPATIMVYQVCIQSSLGTSNEVGAPIYIANASTNGWSQWFPANIYVGNASKQFNQIG